MFRPLTLCALMLAPAAFAAPAELPPANHSGDEYIDSRGCSFWKATLNGQTIWADVIGADGVPACKTANAQEPEAPANAEAAVADSAAPVDLSPSEAIPLLAATRRGASPEFPQDGRYAQVGAFSPRSADEVVVNLQEAGFEVLRQDFAQGRGTLRVLFVGPLGDEAETATRLSALRRLGFRDAFLRVQDPS